MQSHPYPAIMREICYWLLTGPRGSEVMSITVGKLHPKNVLSAVHYFRDRFEEPIGIKE